MDKIEIKPRGVCSSKIIVEVEDNIIANVSFSGGCPGNTIGVATLLKGTFAYVNLIPYNEVSENEFRRSDKESVRAFYEELKRIGVNVTIRKEFGSDIDAACGQLRAKKEGFISE